MPTGGTFRWRANMAQLAGYISLYLKYPLPNSDGTVNERVGLPVVDETNLTGDYDIVVDLQPGHDWFAMLPDQLGLTLEARKDPVEVIANRYRRKAGGQLGRKLSILSCQFRTAPRAVRCIFN
jgi:hypothetical protein